jgi:hypothetical protein
LLERTRTIRIGYGLIVSTGSALALSASLMRGLAAGTAANGSGADDFSCAWPETASVSAAWPAWIAMIAAPIAIPAKIEATATRSTLRALGAGQK